MILTRTLSARGIGAIGPDTDRPPVGFGQSAFYYDTSRDQPIFWNGIRWVDGLGAALGATIALSAATIDDDAMSGDVIGNLSVIDNSAGPWTFSLTDDAGGMFALADNQLVVGLTALDHDAAPTPSITIGATDGSDTLTRTFGINVRAALPALPLAAGAKVMGFGHSFIQRTGWGILADTVPRDIAVGNARGVLAWIRARDNRFNMDAWHDASHSLGSDNFLNGALQGYGGDEIVAEAGAPGTINRTSYIVGLAPDIVYLDIGTNDINSGISADQLISRLDRQVTLLRNQGIWTIIQTISDRTEWPEGDPKAQIVAVANAWIKAQAERDGVRVCDTTEIGDSYPTFDIENFGSDGLHVNPVGAEKRARVLLAILQDMVSPGDVVDISDAVTGNVWPSFGLLGTGGSLSGGITGEIATGHKLTRQAGDSTAVCSKEVIDATFEKQVIAITPSTTPPISTRAHEWRFATASFRSLSFSEITPGADWVEALVYVELSPWDGWLDLTWQVEVYSSGSQVYVARSGLANPDRNTQDLPLTEGFSGWLKIPPFLIPAGVNADRFRLDSRPIVIFIDNTVSGSGTIKISKPIIRKAADPRPNWRQP